MTGNNYTGMRGVQDTEPVTDQDGEVIAEPDPREDGVYRCVECGEPMSDSPHAIASHFEEHRDGEPVQANVPGDGDDDVRESSGGVQVDEDTELHDAIPVVDGEGSQIGLKNGMLGGFQCIECGDEFDGRSGLASHYGMMHVDGGDHESVVAYVREREEQVESEKPSEQTVDPTTGKTKAEVETESQSLEDRKDEHDKAQKSAEELWTDAKGLYQAASEQASRVTKADARRATVKASEVECEWMSVRERSSHNHVDLWVNRGDDLEPWRREGIQYLAELMVDKIGVYATSTEISHVADQLARRNSIDEEQLNRGDTDGLYVRVANGVIDIDEIDVDAEGRIDPSDVELKEPELNDYWTYRVETPWSPSDADLEGLDEWLANVQSPLEAQGGNYWTADQELWWEFAGASLTETTLDDGFLMNLGDGGAGKSMVLQLLKKTLGSENVSDMSLQDIQSNRFASYNVVDKLANIDTELSGTKLNGMDKLKSMAAGEEQFVEDKRASGFFTRNRATMICAADNPPVLPQANNAAARRLYLIEYPCNFCPDPDPGNPLEKKKRPKRQVKDELHSEERQLAALVRAVEGLARLNATGEYRTDLSPQERLDEYESHADPVADFADVCLQVVPGAELHWADIKGTFDNYGRAKGHPGKSWQTLKRELDKIREIPMRSKRTRAFSDGDSQDRVYEGIAFTKVAVDYWVPSDAHWEAGQYREYVSDDTTQTNLDRLRDDLRDAVDALEVMDGFVEERGGLMAESVVIDTIASRGYDAPAEVMTQLLQADVLHKVEIDGGEDGETIGFTLEDPGEDRSEDCEDEGEEENESPSNLEIDIGLKETINELATNDSGAPLDDVVETVAEETGADEPRVRTRIEYWKQSMEVYEAGRGYLRAVNNWTVEGDA